MGDELYEDVDPFLPIQSTEQDQKSIKEVQTINKALKKNISCLYKTAKLELERRDREITQLKRKVTELEVQLQMAATERQEALNFMYASTAAALGGILPPNYYYNATLLNSFSSLTNGDYKNGDWSTYETLEFDTNIDHTSSERDRKRTRTSRSPSPSLKHDRHHRVKKPRTSDSQSHHSNSETCKGNHSTKSTHHSSSSRSSSKSRHSSKTSHSTSKSRSSSTHKSSHSSSKTSHSTTTHSTRSSYHSSSSSNKRSHDSSSSRYLSTLKTNTRSHHTTTSTKREMYSQQQLSSSTASSCTDSISNKSTSGSSDIEE